MTFALSIHGRAVATGRYWAVLAAGVERGLVTLDRNTPRRGEPVVVPRLVAGARMTVVAGAGRRVAA